MDNRFNEVFPSFVPLHSKFSPGNRVIDIFSNYFSFNLFSKQKTNSLKMHIYQLNSLAIKFSSVPLYALVITDTSVKNNITMFISHTHIYNKPLTITLHHVVYIMSTEAELFTIRYSINQATSHNEISKIIIITHSIHVARKIFNPHLILIKFIQYLFLLSFVISSHITRRILLNFGSALAIVTELFTKLLIRK